MSREHHWWPVALQSYWADEHGDVSWIDPSGEIHKKKFSKRKIARKSHGHTFLRDTFWKTNYESEFSHADNSVHDVLKRLNDVIKICLENDEVKKQSVNFNEQKCNIRKFCGFTCFEESFFRSLIDLVCSLALRSPNTRADFETFPTLLGLPSSEEVGKMNMSKNYKLAKRLAYVDIVGTEYITLLFSNKRTFMFGDGICHNLAIGYGSLQGQALIAMTPWLAIHLHCAPQKRGDENCAILLATENQVQHLNHVIQIYSKEYLFFYDYPPILSTEYRRRQFLRHDHSQDPLLRKIREIPILGTSASWIW